MKNNYDFKNSFENYHLQDLHKAYLCVLVNKNNLSVQLLKIRRMGTDFYKGERYFISSDGFIISSDTPVVRMHPRIGRLCLPAEYGMMDTKIHRLEDCPYNRTYFDYMIKAIKEYNEKCSCS